MNENDPFRFRPLVFLVFLNHGVVFFLKDVGGRDHVDPKAEHEVQDGPVD